jgi:hypothetical protein
MVRRARSEYAVLRARARIPTSVAAMDDRTKNAHDTRVIKPMNRAPACLLAEDHRNPVR